MKIIFLIPPAYGDVNPTLHVAYELASFRWRGGRLLPDR